MVLSCAQVLLVYNRRVGRLDSRFYLLFQEYRSSVLMMMTRTLICLSCDADPGLQNSQSICTEVLCHRFGDKSVGRTGTNTSTGMTGQGTLFAFT